MLISQKCIHFSKMIQISVSREALLTEYNGKLATIHTVVAFAAVGRMGLHLLFLSQRVCRSRRPDRHLAPALPRHSFVSAICSRMQYSQILAAHLNDLVGVLTFSKGINLFSRVFVFCLSETSSCRSCRASTSCCKQQPVP